MALSTNNSVYKGAGQLTREQFLFYETRTTAKLLCEGLLESAIIERIITDNLFQYPTEKSLRQVSLGCLKRLAALNDSVLVEAVAYQPSDVAKQICLYAMMKQYRLLWDFMVTVIGAKYRQLDYSFARREINAFLLQLQEQDDLVASWSEATIKKITSVISRILIDNDYIDDAKAVILNPVSISSVLENAIRENGDYLALPAFNCLL